jgi:hypothetical protein
MYNIRIEINVVMLSMMKKIHFIVSALLFLMLSSCSLFSPVMLEQHKWGSLVIQDGYRFITQEYSNTEWNVSYESATINTFSGIVRHTSRINEGKFPMLTHDILITSGDYADSSVVRTSVMNHRFFWSSRLPTRPNGTINLLHTFPQNEQVLTDLYAIDYGDFVTIRGYEILSIDRKKNASLRGTWKDSGCNTLLVTEVIIHEDPEN